MAKHLSTFAAHFTIPVFIMIELLFASNNMHKLRELRLATPIGFELVSLFQVGFSETLVEPYNSLKKNAHCKALRVYEKMNKSCFSEDSGLFVESLKGQPGALSARYAGSKATAEEQMAKLLSRLKGNAHRNAFFRTYICLITGHRTDFFVGECKGTILHEPIGSGGFGYDAIFCPANQLLSFAQMDIETKILYSHRTIAAKAMFEAIRI